MTRDLHSVRAELHPRRAMTVRELRAALEGVDDRAIVEVRVGDGTGHDALAASPVGDAFVIRVALR